MGLKRKILLGFASLGGLLLLAGGVSYVEFSRLNRDMQALADKGARSAEISKAMLDAVQEKNESLLHYFAEDSLIERRQFSDGFEKLKALLTEARILYPRNSDVDSIYLSLERFNASVAQLSDPAVPNTRSLLSRYRDSYGELTYAIKSFMVSSQHTMVGETASLESNAYRAFMPGIIALIAAVVIIVTFYFMLSIYFITPVEKITRGLKNYLTLRIPFQVTVEGKDEVFRLKEYIDQLMAMIRTRKNE